ncbi:MAG: hypothetical protein E6G60_13220 [Actinobacteria bacterium]|nr:MAG: hypothetical protein E6G60_13220 [Actinomycetota bacterium]
MGERAHRHGAIISPTNASEALSGNPIFYLKNVPPSGSGIELKGKGAQLYFGENLPGYVIVKAKSDEFNYVRPGQSDAQTRYSGKDGVKVSNIFKRAAFALRFGDINALISGQISSNSKVIFIRDVRERVSKLAPFLSFDRDPYPAVINNRVVWILDGYTTSGRYPYAQFSDSSGGIPGDVNYVRNSVKATVDAYNGTVRFYIVDHHDPLIRAYQKAFPDLFTDGKKAPDALKAHYRYPQDLFRLQSDVFGKYHVTQARRFYQGTERWLRSPDPLAVTSSVVSEGTRTGRGAQRAPEISATSPRQEPYYLNVRLPGSDPGFVLMQPYVPVSRGHQQTRLTAFITAKSDPGEYGKLEAFVMPQGTNVSGPVQVANSIDSDDMIAQQFTLLDQHGSQLVRGNIQLIPVGSSIVYVQPIYVRQQSDQGFPQFRFVIAYTDGQTPKFADTVDHALEQMFGITTPTPTPTPGPTPTPTPGNQTVRQLLDAANKAFTDAETALKQGDLAEYQRLIGVAQKAVDQALQLAGGTPSSTTTTTAP